MKTNFRKQELLQKYLNNESSKAELEELFDYLNSSEENSYKEIMEDLWNKISAEKILKEKRADHLLRRIIQTREPVRLNSQHSFKWYHLAATILVLIVGAGSIYLFLHKKIQTPSVVEHTTNHFKNDIKPGGTKAILQAGTVQIALNKKDTSFVLAGNTVHINGGDVKVADVKPVRYTLITPRGGEYSLVLGDGTKIWLNADSKLIYPSIFNGKTREVTLKGEAYFKVKEDAGHPFIVHTEKQNIRVLGTEFNVKAYHEEAKCMTTLVKGKVQVNSFGEKILLEPGQQAISYNHGQFRRQNAGIHKVIAWKNGYFWFDNTGIHEIMRQLSRWYDVDVNYEKGLQPRQFMAIVSRDNNISQILGMLEETGVVRFKIEGRKVTVIPVQ